MREIKFRAWLGNRMEYQVLAGQLGNFFAYEDTSDTACCYNTKFTENVPVMQFTGLKDKNGKEIWEGDIIQKDNGVWGVIVWEAPFFEVTISKEQSSLYRKDWIEDCFIIGNIYENSDLVKQES